MLHGTADEDERGALIETYQLARVAAWVQQSFGCPG